MNAQEYLKEWDRGEVVTMVERVAAIEKLIVELSLIAISTATIKHHHKARIDELLGELQYAGIENMGKCTKCGVNFVGAPESLPPDGLCKTCEIQRLTDQLDLARDEFRRIASCPGADSEIKGLCERGCKDINQHVPVIEQRDNAEAKASRLAATIHAAHGLLAPLGNQVTPSVMAIREALDILRRAA